MAACLEEGLEGGCPFDLPLLSPQCGPQSYQVVEAAASFRVCVFFSFRRKLPTTFSSGGGSLLDVCAHKAADMGTPIRKRPVGYGNTKWLFSVLLHICCFRRLCNDGKMIFPLFHFLSAIVSVVVVIYYFSSLLRGRIIPHTASKLV